MKRIAFLSIILLFMLPGKLLWGQLRLFKTYPDSLSLAMDASLMVTDFTHKVKKIFPTLELQIKPVVHTTPNLIHYAYQDKIIVLPLWYHVLPQQKEFFASLAGSYKEGIRMFGLLFNGFYIAREMAHALQFAKGPPDWSNLYRLEYTANEMAMAYWRSTGWDEELKACYDFARLFLAQLPDPVPTGEDPAVFFTTNFAQLGLDPYTSYYFQFRQFVEIYEKDSLPGFEQYLGKFFSK